jgi:hypothetical protein
MNTHSEIRPLPYFGLVPPITTSAAVQLANYSQVDLLGVLNTSVDFGGGKSLVSPT